MRLSFWNKLVLDIWRQTKTTKTILGVFWVK